MGHLQQQWLKLPHYNHSIRAHLSKLSPKSSSPSSSSSAGTSPSLPSNALVSSSNAGWLGLLGSTPPVIQRSRPMEMMQAILILSVQNSSCGHSLEWGSYYFLERQGTPHTQEMAISIFNQTSRSMLPSRHAPQESRPPGQLSLKFAPPPLFQIALFNLSFSFQCNLSIFWQVSSWSCLSVVIECLYAQKLLHLEISASEWLASAIKSLETVLISLCF